MNFDDYLPPAPKLPENRFWLPIRIHKHTVMPLHPCSEKALDPVEVLSWDGDLDALTDDEIMSWELSPCNVGLVCGEISGVIVLEVATQGAQDWLDERELPLTPHWLGRRARYYLFNYVPKLLPGSHTKIGPGLRLLSDFAGVIYPGSIYEDGRFVHWELCPDFAEAAELPEWLAPTGSAADLPD